MATDPPVRKPFAAPPARKTNFTPLSPPAKSGSSAAWIVALIFLFIVVCSTFRYIAAAGFDFFVWGDHILGMSNGNVPIIMWAIAGVFFGAMIGSLIMWRKYHINFKWCLVTVVPFFLIVILLQVLSSPLQSVEPRPLPIPVDSTLVKPIERRPVLHKRKKRQIVKPQPKASDSVMEAVPSRTISTIQPAAATIKARADSDNTVFTAVEISPAYPGGDEAFRKFVQGNIHYPSVAKENKVQGSVYIQFIVERDGRLTDIKIVQDPGSGLGDEALRILKISPHWKPGLRNGKPVRVWYTVPVNFSLGDQ